MDKIINGRKIADNIIKRLQKKCHDLPTKPTLAVILIGDDKSSHLYVSLKEKRAHFIGMNFKKFLLPASTSQKKVLELITKINKDKTIHGLIVQLPLPVKFNTDKIISAIDPTKDADGIHPDHLNKLSLGKKIPVLPATTGAIKAILTNLKIDLTNKSVAIIGKSKIVGLPTYYYLQPLVKKICICDQTTKKIKTQTSLADILIVAIGSAHHITSDYIKKDAVVIDVGINKIGTKVVGDVDYSNVYYRTSHITPVPGGVGRITVAILLQNTIKLYEKTNNRTK